MPKVSEEYFEAKKLEIIDAAYRVALRKSISSMTLMDVREEAGMARGAIYRYYDSLDEILIALIAKINQDNSYLEDVRKIFDMTEESLNTYYDELGATLGEVLITPTRISAAAVACEGIARNRGAKSNATAKQIAVVKLVRPERPPTFTPDALST